MGAYEDMVKRMAGAKMNGKGQKLGDGTYTVEGKLLKLKQGGHFGDSFIFEFTVLASQNPDHPVGSSRTYTVNLGKQQAFGDIKALIFAAIMGIDPSTVQDPTPANQALHDEATDWFKIIVDPDHAKAKGIEGNVGEGLVVSVDVNWRKTQGGHDWALHKWSPAVEAAAA